jgi:hypothetical protein
MLPLSFFDRYWPAFTALPTLPAGERYSRSQLLSDAFHIFAADGLGVFYVPFHHLGWSPTISIACPEPNHSIQHTTRYERGAVQGSGGRGLEKSSVEVSATLVPRTGLGYACIEYFSRRGCLRPS